MKYCVEYNRNFRYLKEIDEIILPYKAEGNLVSFIENTFTKDQRIIIQPVDNDKLGQTIPAARKMIKDGWNIALKLDFDPNTSEVIEDIPFFFSDFATTLEEVWGMAISGASDIYVVEELGFRMKEIKRFKDKYHFNVRVIPNIAQCNKIGKEAIPALQKFFIRPEDTEVYENYIDVFELLGGIDNSRLSVVYEIYKQEQWLGNLNDLIMDWSGEIIPNTGMDPHFAEMRLNCGKTCLYGGCNLCLQMGQLAQSFDKVGIEVIKPRKKPERTEEEKQAILNRLGEKNGSGVNEEIMLSQ